MSEHSEIEQHAASGRVFSIRMEAVECLVAVILLGITGWYLYQAWLLPAPYNPVDVGAGGFPMLLGGATGLAILIMLATTLRKLATGRRDFSLVVGRPLAVVSGAVLFVGMAMVFDRFNTFVIIALFAAAIIAVAGERRPIHLIGVPLAIAFGIWLIFSVLLNVYFI